MFKPFEGRMDFPEMEERILAWWQDRGIFDILRNQLEGKPNWSFIDGPITANNAMGVHHAWGRTYKDIYCRFHAMKGYNQRWQNGFDCQGLWLEVEVERALGFNSKRDIEEYGLEEFSRACRARGKVRRTNHTAVDSHGPVDALVQWRRSQRILLYPG